MRRTIIRQRDTVIELFTEFNGDSASLYREGAEAHLHEQLPVFAMIVIDAQVICRCPGRRPLRGGSETMGSD